MSVKYRSVVLLTALSSTLYAQDATKIDSVTVVEETEQIKLESMLDSQPRDISEMLKNDVKLDIAGGSVNAKRKSFPASKYRYALSSSAFCFSLKASNKYLEEIAQTLLYFYRLNPDFFGSTALKRTGNFTRICASRFEIVLSKRYR